MAEYVQCPLCGSCALFNGNIRTRRELLGLKAEYVAATLGISRAHYCNIESGRRMLTTSQSAQLSNLFSTHLKGNKNGR